MSERRYFVAMEATSLPWLIHSSVRADLPSTLEVAERARDSSSRSRTASKFGTSNRRQGVLRDAAKVLCMELPTSPRRDGPWEFPTRPDLCSANFLLRPRISGLRESVSAVGLLSNTRPLLVRVSRVDRGSSVNVALICSRPRIARMARAYQLYQRR